VSSTPIQSSFASGELSPLLAGHAGSEVAARGLSLCENFQVLPQGPIRRRAGTWYVGEEATAPRLISFRSSSSQEDWILAITAGHIRVYERSGLITGLGPELIVNGNFDASPSWIAGWTVISDYADPWPGGRVGLLFRPGTGTWGRVRQEVTVEVGETYRVAFYSDGWTAVRLGDSAGGSEYSVELSYGNHVVSVVATGTSLFIDATSRGLATGIFGNVSVRKASTVIDLVAPWTVAQIEDLQHAAEPANDKLYLVHGNVATQVVSFAAPATWALAAAALSGTHASAWVGTNWPSVCEMFQGRLLLGAAPGQPNTLSASKSGAPLDFGVSSPVVASDSWSYVISTKGKLRWAQGQKALLVGSDFTEHSANGSAGLITPSDIDVRDESAFGSAAIQAVNIGDQVLFVSRDLRQVRALSYSNDDNGWVARSITFLAEHITADGIAEMHFARSPNPTIVVVTTNGELRCCVYDRGEQVIAWYRVDVGAPVLSAAVCETASGSEIFLSVDREGGYYVERLPLHEASVCYLDSAITVTVSSNELAGLDHLEGEEVTLVVDGAVAATGLVVAGGAVPYEADDGTEVVVGLPYRATAKTLPRAVRLGKVRNAKVGVLLNDSAQPLVNGKRAADRTPATPQDQVEPGRTGRSKVATRGWDGDGVVTLEQDLPVRTEILAIVAVSQAKRV
jgi:hypothetical protein